MKINKLVLGLGLVSIAFTGCKSTQVATTKTKATATIPAMLTATDAIVAKKGIMTPAEIKAWPHMDIFKDSVPGISLERAYDFVKGKKATMVIVGIIDSGVDVEHEDLKDVVWTNPNEIAGNGIDDDKNGYIDDMHGWNFLGGEKGALAPEQLEVTRLYKAAKVRFEGKTITEVAATDKADFEMYQELKEVYLKKAAGGIETLDRMNFLMDAITSIKSYLGKEDFNLSDVTTIKTEDTKLGEQVAAITAIYGRGVSEKQISDYRESLLSNKQYDLDFNGRVTGDDANDWSTKSYGNNNVIGGGKDELHGTHVAGIVAASRNNGIGMNGVAENVQIMTVRAVPDGDEYDKDVALAIRYVVDNGAKVVNMSFGKAYSPHSKWVYDAMKYAEKHDVLLVKAAGNNGEDIDLPSYVHFPTDSPVKGSLEIVDNILTVGAMTRHFDENLCSSFSNYGKTRVDIFAPGSEIYSTVPKDNGYLSIQGTSMASPEVAGVAALVRSYYPSLTAPQVKYIIINSGIEFNREVIIPGTKSKENKEGTRTNFNDLSVNGRILNAYNALVMADIMVNGK
ncbi:MAG: S8 family peptidase [Flavobacteriaceae bacterium]|nr:S8 family peptidase [Flavobacteriaceae bacterium]